MIKKIFNLDTLTLNEDQLSKKQRKYLHLVDKRFFPNKVNPYQSEDQDWSYQISLNLDEELFQLHAMFDPRVLATGAEARFTESINKDYLGEKYFEDKWVSNGNNALALGLEAYIKSNLEELEAKNEIKLLDIGPCGGAITTLFALRALDKYDLLDKTRIYLLDVVPEVLEVTKQGSFSVPQEMIDEYNLAFAGKQGEKYIALMQSDRVEAVLANGENLPEQIQDIDISVTAYVHHHMNLHARSDLAKQTEKVVRANGFIGVVDFYRPTFQDYMAWYKPHFKKAGTCPPVECPLIPKEVLASFYQGTSIKESRDLEKSFMFWGERD